MRDKTPRSTLKKSFTLSETTNSSGVNISVDPPARRFPETGGADLIYNPRPGYTNSELRSTYTAKSPFRENFKKDLMVKNHQKCSEIMSLAVGLAGYEQGEALALSYTIMKNVEKELTNVLESVRKELELKSDEPMMRTFVGVVEGELMDLKGLIMQCREELRGGFEIPLEMIESKKKEVLKKFVGGLGREKLEELVIASRVVDYIMEELVIRRETYEKMSRDKLYSNIRGKMEGL
jgi:hypothetical protein